MPVEHEVISQIVNVHWASGLAVIFGAREEDAPKQEVTEQEKQ